MLAVALFDVAQPQVPLVWVIVDSVIPLPLVQWAYKVTAGLDVVS